ncbi:MAG: CDP-alcohol phosphatidyltransferase family protein [Bacteroidota bacterium]
MKANANIESTYKSKETEELIDILFYRPFGYLIAKLSYRLKLTPNQVTVVSIILGILAGHLFFYNSFSLNVIGIFLLILANALDSADGQLARMTDMKSRYGRILDGFGGNIWFVSIYLHLFFRLINHGYSPLFFIILLLAGLSHSFQSAYADYFRNHFLFFIYGKSYCEIDDPIVLKEEYKNLSWRKNFVKKFLMRVYINYTLQQQLFSKNLQNLYLTINRLFPERIPEYVNQLYHLKNKPLVKYFNILTTNTRMIILFISILISEPVLYFIFELTILNLLFIYMVIRHELNSKEIDFLIKKNLFIVNQNTFNKATSG